MMQTTIKAIIVLPPEGQRRARSRAFLKTSTKTGKKVAISTTYKDAKQRTSEEKLLTLLYEHRPTAPFDGPLLLGVRAYLPIPKSFSNKKRDQALAGELRPTGKPDLSNLIKHLEDVGTHVFWLDDKQIVGYLPGMGKYYGEPARWEITIKPLALATPRDLGEEIDHHGEKETTAPATHHTREAIGKGQRASQSYPRKPATQPAQQPPTAATTTNPNQRQEEKPPLFLFT